MRTTYDREAVDQLARAVLAGRLLNEEAGIDARAELEQFDMVARAFHSDARPGRRAGSRREPLAFGVEGLTAAVTALVLAVAVETLGKLVQERTDRSADRLASWIRRVILRRPEPSPEPSPDPSPEGPSGAGGPAGSREDGPALTPVQMQLIHRAARRHARRMNLPERTAEAAGLPGQFPQALPGGPDVALPVGVDHQPGHHVH
ncbi:hypothetical protein AB0C60_33255, partial [Streptomyces sp. NPDC048845]